MDLDLSNKTALVTGSSSGLGLGIAQALHHEGCNIILNGRSQQRLEKTASTFIERVRALRCDVTSFQECAQMAQTIKLESQEIDILVCNVGSGASVAPGCESPDEWKRVFDLNFFSTTNTIQALRPVIKKHGGTIICVSSICGLEVLDAPLTYSCAKASLNHFVKGIARPLANEGIRINAVAPGNLDFPGSVWERKQKKNIEEVQKMLQEQVCLSRLGTPSEIGKLVAFLASTASSFSTGGIYVADGGQIRS
jgi:3-oxoacyl-[acyl-carrier protein] reductase